MEFTKSELVISTINFKDESLEKIYQTNQNLYYEIREAIEDLLVMTGGVVKVNMVMYDWFEYQHKKTENIEPFLTKLKIDCENLIRTMKEKTD